MYNGINIINYEWRYIYANPVIIGFSFRNCFYRSLKFEISYYYLADTFFLSLFLCYIYSSVLIMVTQQFRFLFLVSVELGLGLGLPAKDLTEAQSLPSQETVQ